MEKWVRMVPNKGVVPDDVKPPSVQIAMRVRVPAMAEMEKTKRRNGRLKRWDDCGCCKDKILQAKNVEFKSHGSLFVRYYLSTGNNKRAQLNSREISAKADLFWNESFSLCQHEDSINSLKQQTVVFELRWRSTNPILGKVRGSQLLGRAEVPWKTVLESPKLEMEKWVRMVSNKGVVPDDVKPPSVQIAMRVRVPAMAEMEKTKRRNGRLKRWDDCGCCKDSGCRCEDYDIFVLVAALEAL
uniref:C2 domain-containing protein n=1 Tax=Salix viminalis TaxID=40686 RepID=A0A6N2LZ78_SALVM